MTMCKIRFSVLIFCISLHYTYQYKFAASEIIEPPETFDILIFSQEWPVTVCKYWQNDLNGSDCLFPKEKNRWTVHGIWPNKFGASYDFCNDSWAFEPEQIKLIESDLDQAWTPIYNDGYKFWRHEWRKHGTCAAELEDLNSQFKYFSKGIELNEKYPIKAMLDAANIFPDDTKEWNPEEFVNAVQARLNKSAMMGCYNVKGVLYVQELRICFDKQFNLIDCKKPAVDEFCRSSKSVVFPANA